MADQLWFLRHGEAEPHGTRPDAERRLTARGERQSMAAGAAIRALGLELHHVFTSPKVRAFDTARLAAESGIAVEPVVHEDVVDLDRATALALAALGNADERVLLVGHNPDFAQVVHDLTGARLRFKKGGLVGVQLGSRPELVAALRPAELSLVGGVPLGV